MTFAFRCFLLAPSHCDVDVGVDPIVAVAIAATVAVCGMAFLGLLALLALASRVP